MAAPASGTLRRILRPIVDLREEETRTVVLMFAYSFLGMFAYNIIKPTTTSKFIKELGAENLPYVMLVAGFFMSVLMQGYSRGVSLLPRRWVFQGTQITLIVLLLIFWALLSTGQAWVSVGLYFYGRLLLGIFLVSQFWTLANDIYDARQAKRVFGFIGGGASLGGIAGAGLTALLADQLGTENLLLVSAAVLAVSVTFVSLIVRRERPPERVGGTPPEEESIGGKAALRFLRESKHLRLIALVIGFAAMGAVIIEQQLNMAADAKFGGENALTQFLAGIIFYTSTIGFLIQIWLTSRIHRLFGIGFALMVLPVGLGFSGLIMLLNPVLWAPTLARIFDTSLRYTLDKTTREILFLPLPADLKLSAKPFVDVAVDRFMGKGVASVLLLVLLKVFNFSWPQLSYLSLTLIGLWLFMTVRARREYLAVFRRSLDRREIQPLEVRATVADLSTIETLVQELSHPEERRVLYAIDLLESLDKRAFISPLLLHHESPRIRARTIAALQMGPVEVVERSLAIIERLLKDESPEVRAAALGALATVRSEKSAQLMRRYLEDRDPRIAATAAVALAASPREEDVTVAEARLKELSEDARDAAAPGRREVASAISQIQEPRFRYLLIPLMHDANVSVAKVAIESAGQFGAADYLFVPTLISLLRNRELKTSARKVLVSYGEGVLDALEFFLRDPDENIWVRRHIPATVALIPSQKAVDILVRAIDDPDGFLRYKVVAAIEKLRREHPELTVDRVPVEALVSKEALRYFNYLSLHYNLFHKAGLPKTSLLASALSEKLDRVIDRLFRLLSLLLPWKDVAAARWAIERGEPRARASAVEYLDNVLPANVRKRIMPILEDMPIGDRVLKGNVMLKTRMRDEEETLLQLINDEDAVISATAIDFVRQRGVWSLADDLEHVLAHRDAKDWYVFEAASWALATHRLSGQDPHARWLEALPAVELAAQLRQIPLFAFTSVNELFRLAGIGRQVRHEAGRSLYQEGAAATQFQFLLNGKVALKDHSGTVNEVTPPASLAFNAVLEATPMRETAQAVERSVSLVIGAEEFLTLLSDNIELASGLFRMTLSEDRGTLTPVVKTRGDGLADARRFSAGGLNPVERAFLLQSTPPFSRTAAEELLDVGALGREVAFTAGSTVVSETEGRAFYVVVTGELVLETQDGKEPIAAGPGDTVGLYETLAGVPLNRRGRATSDGIVLRIDGEDFFELLAARVGLMQALFSTLFRTGHTTKVLTF